MVERKIVLRVKVKSDLLWTLDLKKAIIIPINCIIPSVSDQALHVATSFEQFVHALFHKWSREIAMPISSFIRNDVTPRKRKRNEVFSCAMLFICIILRRYQSFVFIRINFVLFCRNKFEAAVLLTIFVSSITIVSR